MQKKTKIISAFLLITSGALVFVAWIHVGIYCSDRYRILVIALPFIIALLACVALIIQEKKPFE
jgi:hypothetical protein